MPLTDEEIELINEFSQGLASEKLTKKFMSKYNSNKEFRDEAKLRLSWLFRCDRATLFGQTVPL
jgi:hypothetical protein